jgi:DNA-binding LacI/PurR family transcriptional regulator
MGLLASSSVPAGLALAGMVAFASFVIMPMRAPPTMKDVALAAGVARSTVSLALRNDRSIPPATRGRIFAAAEKLGYKTNPLVSALMTSLHARRTSHKHTVLAYVTTDPEDAPWRTYRVFLELREGAEKRAEELGYHLQEMPLRTPGMTTARFAQILRARGIIGLLVAPLPHGERTIELDFEGFAVVGIDMSVATPPIERVSNDHFQSALLAVEHCRKLGYRRIGFVINRELSERLENRWLGACRCTLADTPRSARVEPLLVERGAGKLAAMSAWYAREKPDVVVMSDVDPRGHYPLPPLVGIVSLSVEEPFRGMLAGVFQDHRRLGAIAIEHLVARLERCEFGPDDRGRLHLVAGQWLPGDTAPGRGSERLQLL